MRQLFAHLTTPPQQPITIQYAIKTSIITRLVFFTLCCALYYLLPTLPTDADFHNDPYKRVLGEDGNYTPIIPNIVDDGNTLPTTWSLEQQQENIEHLLLECLSTQHCSIDSTTYTTSLFPTYTEPSTTLSVHSTPHHNLCDLNGHAIPPLILTSSNNPTMLYAFPTPTHKTPFTPRVPSISRLFGFLNHWDGAFYQQIAAVGYVHERVCAFFPLLPASLHRGADILSKFLFPINPTHTFHHHGVMSRLLTKHYKVVLQQEQHNQKYSHLFHAFGVEGIDATTPNKAIHVQQPLVFCQRDMIALISICLSFVLHALAACVLLLITRTFTTSMKHYKSTTPHSVLTLFIKKNDKTQEQNKIDNQLQEEEQQHHHHQNQSPTWSFDHQFEYITLLFFNISPITVFLIVSYTELLYTTLFLFSLYCWLQTITLVSRPTTTLNQNRKNKQGDKEQHHVYYYSFSPLTAPIAFFWWCLWALCAVLIAYTRSNGLLLAGFPVFSLLCGVLQSAYHYYIDICNAPKCFTVFKKFTRLVLWSLPRLVIGLCCTALVIFICFYPSQHVSSIQTAQLCEYYYQNILSLHAALRDEGSKTLGVDNMNNHHNKPITMLQNIPSITTLPRRTQELFDMVYIPTESIDPAHAEAMVLELTTFLSQHNNIPVFHHITPVRPDFYHQHGADRIEKYHNPDDYAKRVQLVVQKNEKNNDNKTDPQYYHYLPSYCRDIHVKTLKASITLPRLWFTGGVDSFYNMIEEIILFFKQDDNNLLDNLSSLMDQMKRIHFDIQLNHNTDYTQPALSNSPNEDDQTTTTCTLRLPLFITSFSTSTHPKTLYPFIQHFYWNIGFLSYYTPQQIPNFLLVAPILYFLAMFFSTQMLPMLQQHYTHYIQEDGEKNKKNVNLCQHIVYLFHFVTWSMLFGLKTNQTQQHHTTTTTKAQNNKTNENTNIFIHSPAFFPLLVLLLVMVIFGLGFMHVQVITRFVTTNPMVYWIMVLVYQQQRQHNHPTSLTTPSVLLWSLLYAILGCILFTLFGPWT